MMNLILKKLTRYGFSKIYRNHMRTDFAAEERKPCAVILRGIADNSYVCYGVYDDENRLVGYAVVMLAQNSGMCLLDYLAVVRGYRDKGYGREIIQLLRQELHTRDGIIIEYEHTAGVAPEDDRCRRERFYLGVGMRRTGMDLTLYGVHFHVGYIPAARDRADADLKRDLIDLYKDAGYQRFSFADELS